MAKQQQQYREMAVPRDAAGGRRSLIPFRRYIAEQRGNIRRQSTVRMVFFGIWMRFLIPGYLLSQVKLDRRDELCQFNCIAIDGGTANMMWPVVAAYDKTGICSLPCQF
ncbi:hypothetical protein OPV22_014842 [Ensete ventricosum]|uniref:Uncharacterized protein n=1 Tax=Ensete ventricosum TaxID=4639 RepID=A0AAV8R803_ENSVE|nr:hypothetical protein OPV22_014842 [Ensete ventricosum]